MPQPDMGSKAVFCGNFEYDARESEIERLFSKYGRVNRVDMKTGFAFVYMDDDRDADEAIYRLDRREFGKMRRRLKVEWAKQPDGLIKQREEERRNFAKQRPSKTLFVVNFDPIHTQTRDLERVFRPFGRTVRLQIKKNFCFVQYEDQEDATRAMEETNGSSMDGRVLTVEYAAREIGDPPSHLPSPTRGRSRSPDRSRREDERRSPDYGRYRSRSPPRRHRSRSPDYDPYRR